MRTYPSPPRHSVRPDARHYETAYEANFHEQKSIIPQEERRFMPKAQNNVEPVDLATLDAEIDAALKRMVKTSYKSTYGDSYGRATPNQVTTSKSATTPSPDHLDDPHTKSLSRYSYVDQHRVNPTLIEPALFRRRHRVGPADPTTTSTFTRDFLRPESGASGQYGTTYGAQFGESSLYMERSRVADQTMYVRPNFVERDGHKMEYRTVVQKSLKYRKQIQL
ncbi:hypothetical protein M427DRAFT_26943 [Gonapodya prolifera JEL478]|uniref:Uncharacterized protein n=1 Tax=Gonapodya prolifera (strain JEL478) TaxID=1344416 RepID=A0A139B0P5_GONPJ|nr:hypothetical protein M427DRAFT_26943 [Gonapodya prolifera JEL478]|eukprot:KXS22373.1 hypothetical protein M427DRAFT_26943 [Gonapodya prolifera JEL478]